MLTASRVRAHVVRGVRRASSATAPHRRRCALITGSTTGIGRGIAERLAGAGYNVVINGLGDAAAIEADCRELAARHNVQVRYDPADMLRPAAIEAMIGNAAAAFGGVDVLVNNAGIQFVSPIEEFPDDAFERIMAINFASVFHTTKHSIPHMKRLGWGRIVNIASAHAQVASKFKSAYVASKHAVAGFTKTAALELGPHGITANAVCPGYVLTELVQKQIPVTAKARGISEAEVVSQVMLGNQPTGQFVGVDEVAAMVEHLCSDLARSVNGAIISVDGGWTAH
jgi:3-hydroxybutyrate dehydrogenase